MRPNFGASCLSIRSLLLLDCMVTITEGLPVPYGLGIALIEGMECVVGAKTRCNRELAWNTAPRILIAPERTHMSYCPTNAKV